MLGRTETRTRDRMYCQTIRTVRDISRDNRARIATCSFANTDRQTYLRIIRPRPYSIDEDLLKGLLLLLHLHHDHRCPEDRSEYNIVSHDKQQ